MNDVEHICKISWDLDVRPLNISGLVTIKDQLEKSGGDVVAIKNVTRDDLSLMKDALCLYSSIHVQFNEMQRSIRDCYDLMSQLLNEVREFTDKEKKFLDDVVQSIDISREKNGLDKRLRRKI